MLTLTHVLGRLRNLVSTLAPTYISRLALLTYQEGNKRTIRCDAYMDEDLSDSPYLGREKVKPSHRDSDWFDVVSSRLGLWGRGLTRGRIVASTGLFIYLFVYLFLCLNLLRNKFVHGHSLSCPMTLWTKKRILAIVNLNMSQKDLFRGWRRVRGYTGGQGQCKRWEQMRLVNCSRVCVMGVTDRSCLLQASVKSGLYEACGMGQHWEGGYRKNWMLNDKSSVLILYLEIWAFTKSRSQGVFGDSVESGLQRKGFHWEFRVWTLKMCSLEGLHRSQTLG